MLRRLMTAAALATLCTAPGWAGETKADRASVERVMSQWPEAARVEAERMIVRYGLPDRVTDTILIWDAEDTAQQQAMVDLAGEPVTRAEAGDDSPR